MNIKELIPYVQDELAAGRTKNQIYKELGFTYSQRRNMSFYLNKAEKIKAHDTPAVRSRNNDCPIVVYKGKIYRDITRKIIDCGG